MTYEGKKYISLKKAAELSGYAPDYVGQLIRQGKLPGKKVYANVAWMTTAEDLQAYMREAQNGNGNGNGSGKKRKNGNGGHANGRRVGAFHVARPLMYFLAGFLVAAVFALFYILAVRVESRIENRTFEGIDPETTEFEIPEGGYQSL